MKNTNETSKRYAIFGTTGRRFSFNAKNDQEAESKLFGWLRYHGMTDIRAEFEVREDDSDMQDLHNEWVS